MGIALSSGARPGDETGAGGRQIDDGQLVKRSVAGDLEAFEELYRRHSGRVYALCLLMASNRKRAERLTQDAFVRAWEKLPSFRGDAAFTTWLHRLTVNVVLTDRRSRRRRRERETPLPDPAALQRATPPPSVGMRIDLERAIAALPDGAREVFILHELEGYTHEEIADMVDIAVGTSKSQLHRARTILKGLL